MLGSSGMELDRLLAAVRRRRELHAARARAAGGEGVPVTARTSGGVPARASAPVTGGASGGVVLDVRDVGGTVRILRVARPPGFTFQAGQAIKLGLPGVALRRTYSIASAPHEAHLEFCIERVPGGRLSSRLFALAPGARLELAPKPKGSFALQSGKSLHLMVATVTGIAPLRSLLRAALAAPGSSGQYWILHGASYADELPYADELSQLGQREPRVRYLPSVSRPGAPRNAGWPGRLGRVDAQAVATAQSLGAPEEVAVYACGHPEMVRNVRNALGPFGYAVSGEDFG